jgi:ankyrin repeat protein
MYLLFLTYILLSANAEGLTPLHEAARKGAADACACLLEKGASVTARSGRGGMTPLHLAVSANHEATVRVMLRKGTSRR